MTKPVPTPRGGARGAHKAPAASASFPEARRHTVQLHTRLPPAADAALRGYARAYHGGNLALAIADAIELATAAREAMGR